MTPQAGVDPTQQKMMMIMPVVLIFVFVSTPAGALIYWLVGNVWRIGQQYLTNYLIGPPNVQDDTPAGRAAREARRRRQDRRRCAGAGLSMADTTTPIVEFLNRFTAALGIDSRRSTSRRRADGPRLNLSGEEAELLVRHRGEPLKALQHVVDMAFGRSFDRRPARVRRCAGLPQGQGHRAAADGEVPRREGASETGLDQQLGPLNPYERRIVHLAAAEVPGVTHRERRRRVLEDRSHLVSQVDRQ